MKKALWTVLGLLVVAAMGLVMLVSNLGDPMGYGCTDAWEFGGVNEVFQRGANWFATIFVLRNSKESGPADAHTCYKTRQGQWIFLKDVSITKQQAQNWKNTGRLQEVSMPASGEWAQAQLWIYASALAPSLTQTSGTGDGQSGSSLSALGPMLSVLALPLIGIVLLLLARRPRTA